MNTKFVNQEPLRLEAGEKQEEGKQTIQNMKLNTGTINGAGDPEIKISMFPCFKEHHSIATIKLCNLVQIRQIVFCIQLGVLLRVWQHRDKVVEQVTVPVCYSS
jgi:hypothetical protein